MERVLAINSAYAREAVHSKDNIHPASIGNS